MSGFTTSPIDIITLLTYHGPNIFGPQPGVLLRVRCDKDYSTHFKDAFKDGVLFIGLVVAYLDVSVVSDDTGWIISVSFTTPMPDIGTALVSYVVEGVCAQERGDEAWDRETPLVALQQHRRHTAPALPLIQLMAEAHARRIPVLHLPDGQMQFGYGVRGWRFDPALYADTTAHIPPPHWERLGAIPIYAVTGEQLRGSVVERAAAVLLAAGTTAQRPVLRVVHDADFDTTLALLTDPTTESLLIGLRTADIVRRGVAFRQCHTSIITDRDGECPPDAANATEWVQALGVPMLIATDAVVLNSDDVAVAGLVPYSPHDVVPLSKLETVFAELV